MMPCPLCNNILDSDYYSSSDVCDTIDQLSGESHFKIKKFPGNTETIAIIDNHRISILLGEYVMPRTLIEKYVTSSKLELVERTFKVFDFPLDVNFINNYMNYKILL